MLMSYRFSGLFFVTPGRFHNEQKNSTRAGDAFGEWLYAPCPWFLGMDTGGSMALHKRQLCRRILSLVRIDFSVRFSTNSTSRRWRPNELHLHRLQLRYLFEEFRQNTTY
jgi:hypothetical protein